MAKVCPKNPEKLHGFIIPEIGMILGKPIIEEDNLVGIKNPRVLATRPAERKDQPIMKKIIPLTGSPDEYFFSNKPGFFEIKDKEIFALYAEQVSGIKITDRMPTQ
jgi:hypothetical protein